LVAEDDILAVLSDQVAGIEGLVATISPQQELFRYAPVKWSLRQVFGHLGDAERVFGYRALCIARGQLEPLPPFDENLFVQMAKFDERPLFSLTAEWLMLRRANLSMLHSLEESAWNRTCLANHALTSTRAVAWIMAGHLRHHLAILSERYGVGAGK
jgi:hypothetical protein